VGVVTVVAKGKIKMGKINSLSTPERPFHEVTEFRFLIEGR